MDASTELRRSEAVTSDAVVSSLDRLEIVLRQIHAALAPQAVTERWMTEASTARFLNVSRRTLQHWRLQGGGPKYSKAGSSKRAAVRYSSKELDRWLKSRSQSLTAEQG